MNLELQPHQHNFVTFSAKAIMNLHHILYCYVVHVIVIQCTNGIN